VDDALLDRLKKEMHEEFARTGPPDGFPAFHDIPAERYTSDEFWELEQQCLWPRAWVLAGRVDDVAGVGDFFCFDELQVPVIVIRGKDDVVRAFYNTCQHRGAPVVREESGSVRQLRCQYHSWTYDITEGALIAVPDERDFVGLCRDERALRPVRCERWGGWWFVNLDDDAMPLLEWLHPLPLLLDDVARSPLRVFDVKSVELDCNWKILAEGFLEVYHARTIHPASVAPTLDTRGTVISLFDHGHQNMISPVKPGTRSDRRDDLGTIAHVPPMFDELCNPAHGIFPNVITPMDKRGFPFLVFWPTAIDRTRLDIVWFASDWGEGDLPGRDTWQLRLERFDGLMDEDYQNLEPIQRSMEHAAHGGQFINYQERRIWHVQAWIDNIIGPERIPEHLRVPDLLAAWEDRP
jgi:phenylpropionate dioxygenase-like ring-hydroxylating dioxygenase large terminal subunit